MDFGYDAKTLDLRKRLLAFMDERVFPAEAVFSEQVEAAVQRGHPWGRVPVTEELQAAGPAAGRVRPLVRRWGGAGDARGAPSSAGAARPEKPGGTPGCRKPRGG